MRFINNSRNRYGISAIAISIIFIAVLVVLNITVSFLTERYPIRIDMTATGAFEISEQTIGFLENLELPVEIILLADPHSFRSISNYHALVLNLIQQYARFSNNISVSFVDLLRTPAFAAQHHNYNLRENDVLIVAETRTAHIPSRNMFNYTLDRHTGLSTVISSTAEQTLTSAIYNITLAVPTRIALLGGMDGFSPLPLIQLLEVNGFDIEIYNFVVDDVHPETEIALLVAPGRDLTRQLLNRLEEFLYNDGQLGRTLFYVAGPDQPPLPYLEAFLEEWGIAVRPGIVFETNPSHVVNLNHFIPVVNYTDWSILTDEMLINPALTIMPYGRPLEVVFDTRDSRFTNVLLSYTETSGVQAVEFAQDDRVQGDAETTGPIPALVVSSQFDFAGRTQGFSNVIVSSSLMSLDESVFHSPALGNAEYFLNLFNVVAMRESPVNIVPRTLGGLELGITSTIAVVLGIIFVGLVPFSLIALGTIKWIRRRNR